VFCASCGAATGGGNFCAVCGVSLRADATAHAAPVDPADWADEVRYDVIAAIPGVRDRIAENLAAATQSANMQTLLDRIDQAKTGSRDTQTGIAVAEILLSRRARKGVKVSAERAQLVQRPVGWVLADVLYVLAGCGHRVQRVQQGTDGCVLECVIVPGPHLLIGGELMVTVERTGQGTGVRAVTHLPGLIRDRGVSRRILDQVFNELL
jgi:hypothetical protein